MHVIEKAREGVLAIELTGRTKVDDYEAIIPALESEIETQDALRVIFDVSELEAVEPQVIWRDVAFDMHHRVDSGRIAIIGSKGWEKWATRMFRPAPDVVVRFFRIDERDAARKWVYEEP